MNNRHNEIQPQLPDVGNALASRQSFVNNEEHSDIPSSIQPDLFAPEQLDVFADVLFYKTTEMMRTRPTSVWIVIANFADSTRRRLSLEKFSSTMAAFITSTIARSARIDREGT